MVDDVLKELRGENETALGRLNQEFAKVRTGRANANLLDSVTVDYYGTPTRLNQLANIAVPEARLITVTPYDKGSIQDIEKAIMAANLGLNPNSEGQIIRIPVPALTEDRRKDLVTQVKKIAEECRVNIRSNRRSSNELLKAAQKDKELSEDDLKRAMDKVQTVIDDAIKQVDGIFAGKEKDIMTV